MLKLILTGIWVCIVTLGAVWFSISRATAPVEDASAGKKIETEVLKGESLTIPMIADGGVQGYFLGRVSLIVDKAKASQIKMPVTEVMTDELYTLLVGSAMIDLTKRTPFDLPAFKAKIKDDLNARFGGDMISDVLVEQLDYLTKEDIRVNSKSKTPTRSGVKIIEGEKPPAAAAPAGH